MGLSCVLVQAFFAQDFTECGAECGFTNAFAVGFVVNRQQFHVSFRCGNNHGVSYACAAARVRRRFCPCLLRRYASGFCAYCLQCTGGKKGSAWRSAIRFFSSHSCDLCRLRKRLRWCRKSFVYVILQFIRLRRRAQVRRTGFRSVASRACPPSTA